MPPRDRLIRLHIQNDPLSPNDAVTPPRFAKGATGFPELRRRLRVTFGVDPPALEEGLREAEILVVAHVDGRDLRARAAEDRVVTLHVEMLERLAIAADLREEASGQHGLRVGCLAAALAMPRPVATTVTRRSSASASS